MIKAVIFDLDNTLVDFMAMKDASIKAAVHAMVDAGLQMSEQEAYDKIYQIYQDTFIENQEVFDHFLQQELGKLDHRLLAAGIIGYRRAREASLVLYPHVRSTLSWLLRQGLQLAILSDAPSRQAWLRLTSLGLVHFFDTVITFEDTGYRKPHAAPFLKVLEKLELVPGEVIMVGDWMERDIAGASLLSIPTAYARYGDTFDTTESHADYILDDINDLRSLIEKLKLT
jgi:putative hydrolase of the HAD superfamily